MPTSASSTQTVTRRTPARRAAKGSEAYLGGATVLVYHPGKGSIKIFTESVARASPLTLVELERQGVSARLFNDLRDEMGLSSARMGEIFKFPRSTLASKIKSKAPLRGREGLATIKMVKLLAQAQRIVDNSTSDQAEGFDTALWLGQWLEQAQPALNGLRPSDLLDTETGTQMVHQLLGAMESGAYL
jgi:putative toxin-antitoxin system antitoxin component (TIGR02293 family)